MKKWMKRVRIILAEKRGAGVIEMVLILVVLISLVIIFKGQLTSLLNLIFQQIESSAGAVF